MSATAPGRFAVACLRLALLAYPRAFRRRYGPEMLADIPFLSDAVPLVRHHHERWDGRGYPDGLAGEAIPPLARVVAVADAFDAMTSDRPYRKGMAAEAAFAEVERMSGRQFDPRCARAFLDVRDVVLQELRKPDLSATPQPRRAVAVG